MDKPASRKAASVHQKLLDKARRTRRPFNELLQYYAMERFLYRMSRSVYVNQFVLKGALLLRTTGISEIRSTRDIDFLNTGDSSLEKMKSVIAECCEVQVEADGIEFESKDIVVEEIREKQLYDGYRFRIKGSLGNAKIFMQIDMAFGDVVTPSPIWIEYPTLLDDRSPKIQAYTLETAIAEKYQAMIVLDLMNSRMKDFYDIWFLSKNFQFDGEVLQKAIKQTFARRSTDIPFEKPVVFKDLFYADDVKVKQWKAFKRKIQQSELPSEFQLITDQVEKLLWPPSISILQEEKFTKTWQPAVGWES